MADSKSQKEYNDLLKISQSMIGEIIDSMSELEKSSDKRNKKLQQEISLNKQILSQIETEEDLYAAIEMIKERGASVSKQDFGVNQKLSEKYLAQLKAVEGIAESHKQSKALLEKVNNQVDQTSESFKNSLSSTQSFIEGIPVIGKTLSKLFDPLKEKGEKVIDKAAFKFKTGFGKSFGEARAGGQSFTKSLQSGLSGGMKSLGQFAKVAARALGPIGLIILGIAAAFGLGLKRFQELDAAAESFRQKTGLLLSQTSYLASDIKSISHDMAQLGVNAEDVASAAGDFVNEFGGIEQPSKEVLSSMVMLNKNFGIGTQEAAKLNKVFQNIGNLTAAQSQALIGQTVQLAKQAGVAPQQVIKDMADSSEVAYQFFGGSATELAKAAVQAAALGTSMAEAGKVARGLLDYQSSISSELEAGAILGTNINLSQARYLAANGKVLESQQAVLESVSQLGDLTKLNVYEQEALSQATGMEFSQLVNQQRIRERFGKLKEKELAAAMALVSSGKDITKLSGEDLRLQTQRMARQEEMQSQMSQLSNVFGALGTSFMDMLAPVADMILPILIDIGRWLGQILMPIFSVVGSILGIVGAVVKVIWNIAGIIVDAIITPIVEVFKSISSLFDYIESKFEYVSDMFSTIRGYFSFGAETEGPVSEESGTRVTSVNDAVISPQGDIISTSPQDYLIATKNPSDLVQTESPLSQTPSPLSEVSTNVMNISQTIPMDGIIAELKDLKSAFLSNKDVYLGREKVTAAVTVTQERSSKNSFGMSLA